ncbi:hypothetical protein OsJ_02358 [Oryza sativa Japonica Group]|nr:hypothetical protein OsJ_02358 [Oryza sativa Japonica Group]
MVGHSFNLKKIQVTVGSLESTIGDMKEFVVFLMDCPRILRQPYITYLFMERCMFGRHKEKAHIISFLMQPSNSTLEVLPVIGPREIGKKTLVAHKVSRLGTTPTLQLKEMHPDEFWYFFRTLSFGSENPDEHQVLLPIAIKIATLMSGDFVCANVLSSSSYSTTRNLVECGTRKIASEDISLKGVAAPSEGSFELVKWRSPIPPYYSYLVKECVVQKASEVVPEDRGLKRKRRV